MRVLGTRRAATAATSDDKATAHASPPQPTLLSRLTFAWVRPLLRRGATKQLEHDALEPLWHEDDLHHVGPWGRDWEADKRWRPLFVRRCGRLFLLQSACRLASDAAMVAQPSNPNPSNPNPNPNPNPKSSPDRPLTPDP